MKIVLTGSNGLLGQKLVQKLRHDPEVDLVATSRGANRLLHQEDYQYEALDIADAKAVQNCLQKHRPDALIHTAAMTHVDQCEQDQEACHKLNVEAVRYLVEACAITETHLVHLSTDFIFDGADGPYTETDDPDPVSYYGESKLRGEQIIQGSGISAAILRTILVYGVAENMSRSNLVLWAKKSLEEDKSIKVVDDQFRSPTLAEDLAEGCVLAAKQRATGIYNISGPKTFSILELVWQIADFWNLNKGLITAVSSNTLDQPAKRPPRTGFDISKAQRELGYEPHSFTEGLRVVDLQLRQRKD